MTSTFADEIVLADAVPRTAATGSPLYGELRTATWAFCREIAASCAASDAHYEGVGLSHGAVGGALYLAAWHRASGDPAARDTALAQSQATFDALAGAPLRLDWIGGLAGTTWALRRLAALDGEPPAPDFSEDVDRMLVERLRVDRWSDDYDLISGLVGDGLYALDHPDCRWRERIAGEVLRHLRAAALTSDAGTTWFTAPELLPGHQRELYPHGYHNLGVAHGVPGVVGFLARCVEANCHAAAAAELLDGAMRWLLAQSLRLPGRSPPAHERGYYASFAESERPTRLAWCYGDLGIGAVLLRAAAALDRSDWRTFALAVARDCASRSVDESLVNDLGLCHGSAGAALVFLRLWQQTGDAALADAVRFWTQRTLAMRLPEFSRTAGVFRAEWKDGEHFPVACTGYITGAAGVGLALLTALDGEADAWDAPLLTDLPRGAPP